jgi:hypothetical protein
MILLVINLSEIERCVENNPHGSWILSNCKSLSRLHKDGNCDLTNGTEKCKQGIRKEKQGEREARGEESEEEEKGEREAEGEEEEEEEEKKGNNFHSISGDEFHVGEFFGHKRRSETFEGRTCAIRR